MCAQGSSKEDFLEKNSSFNAKFETFDIDNIFKDNKFSVGSFFKEASRTSPEIEGPEIFLTRSLAVKEIIHLLTPIEYPPTSEEGIAIIIILMGGKCKFNIWDKI
ncbi:17156_t:CDS:2 [Cetraspora pellucida]|uniref:17156_t:CDS:1 n=1 Tax=Cetraspora pellucida TaxID=1433469 RepID=A0ACA9K0Q7_9GLOM|nr:17156_t:CDS:2 [Cetraspora pellucida]